MKKLKDYTDKEIAIMAGRVTGKPYNMYYLEMLRRIEDGMLDETKNLIYDNDSEDDFEEIDFDK